MPLPADTALLLLGPPELRAGGDALLSHAKPRMVCLLAYVAVEGMVAKTDVAALFWPEAPLPSARANLRQLLRRIRTELGDAAAVLESPADHLALSTACGVDLRRFEADQAAPDPAALEVQLALYRGDFLQGLPLDGCDPDLRAWIDTIRQRCRHRAGALAAELATTLARQEHQEAALRHAQQALLFDPANQRALHLAMLLLSRSGAPQRALELYRNWERRLVSDVAALPAPETHALYQQISKGAWESEASLDHPHSGGFERRMLSVLAMLWPVPEDDCEPEIAAELCDSLHIRCGEIMTRFGAHLTGLPQGGLLAWFGYPASQTHSTMTALRAAAALYRQVPETAEMTLVLHADSALCNSRAPDVSGKLARAVLDLATAVAGGSLAATAACFAALDRPRWLAAAPHAAGAVSHYLMRWHCWSDAAAPGAAQGVPAMAGRTAELATLHQRWEVARRGELSLVQVGGAAGMGKSHLLRSFLAEAQGLIMRTQCDQFVSDTPLHPVLSMFGAAMQAPGGAVVRQAMTRHVPLPVAARRMAEVMSGTARPVTLEALEQVIDGLVAAVTELAAAQPLVVAIEDVHWADPSTLAFLSRLGRHASAARVLVLASSRGSAPLWSGVPACRIELGALDEHAGQALVRALNPALDMARVTRILAVGGGHPLFLSELAQRPDEQVLPSTIGELVQARLDELGAVRKLAQLAALIGQGFKRTWLQVMARKHGFEASALETLVHTGLLREAPARQLVFSHALLRDAVIASLPGQQIRELSGSLGQTLTSQFAGDLEQMPEQAARWFTGARQWQAALSWRLKACNLAISYVAYPEAVREMDAGLALLPHLSIQVERDDWERAFRNICHQAVTPVRGVHSDASAQHYQRIAMLSETTSGLPVNYDAMRALMYATEAQRGQRALLHLLRRLTRMPEVQAGDDGTLLRLRESQVHALMLSGRFRQAEALRASLLARPAPAPAAILDSHSHDALVCLAARGVTLGMHSGNWMDYATIEHHCLEQARNSRKPLTLAYVLTFLIMAYLPARMPRRLTPLIGELQALSEKQGLAVFNRFAQLAHVSCRVIAGDHAACRTMAPLLDEMRTYAAFCCPGFQLYHAEGWHRQRQTAQAWDALRDGETDMARYGMFMYRPEYLILRATLTSERPAAQALLDHAYRIAMRQGAQALALRALVAMAQLHGGHDMRTRQHMSKLLAQLPPATELPVVADAVRWCEK